MSRSAPIRHQRGESCFWDRGNLLRVRLSRSHSLFLSRSLFLSLSIMLSLSLGDCLAFIPNVMTGERAQDGHLGQQLYTGPRDDYT